ncbi:FIST signal transduction protein [Duganella sp. BuS-21]|uniref:FIST signal transduction protein n=1 Tax=Duganella sp. BuS-21 TaxID=2943848 RepID=UPI0035A5E4CE
MWTQRLDASQRTQAKQQTRQPDLIFLFEATELALEGKQLASLRQRFPGTPIVGCSSGTIIEGQYVADDSATALAVGFDHTPVRLATHPCPGPEHSREAGRALGARLAAADLSALLILSDGLHVNGSALIAGLRAEVGEDVAISGGLAGDGPRFARTLVHADGAPQSQLVAAIGFYGPHIQITHGSVGGWDVFGPNRTVTASTGQVLQSLDHKPALDLYERYLGDEAADLPSSALLYPLQIWDVERPRHSLVRTVTAIDREARAMGFAGNIPQGWHARLMRGRLEGLIDGASDAAQHALDAMRARSPGATPQLCLTISCVGRRLLMGQRTEEEVRGVAEVLGAGVEQIGFYSYGEIAPHQDSGVCDLHNQTMTLTLFAETAPGHA